MIKKLELFCKYYLKIKKLWSIVFILFCLFLYKIYLYNDYKYYVSEYNKYSNYYYALKILQKDSKKYAKEVNFKIKEYYFIPSKGEFIVIGEDGFYNGKKIYGIYLKFYSGDMFFSRWSSDNRYIISENEMKELFRGNEDIYKLNDEKLEELYKKIEIKSGEIYGKKRKY